MRQFLSGAIAAGLAVIALHFLRFRRESSDRLFSWFAAAFLIMGANHAALAFLDPDSETRVALYALRLAAFGLILVAIVRANTPE
jgi:hypothetical protein